MGLMEELTTKKPPRTLYHYTDQKGLLGILESDTLWATKIQYLNDSTEYLLSLKLAERLLQERLTEEKDPKHRAKIKKIQGSSLNITHMNVCVCSFSERKDALSQWRAYSGNAGFSIGFNSSNIIAKAIENNFIIAQCIYDEKEQIHLIKRLIEESLANDVITEKSSDPYGFKRKLGQLSSIIKHKAFHEEKEWRLISSGGINFDMLSFRPGLSMITPYYNFKLGSNKEEYLDSVVIGPSPHPELSEKSIDALLYRYKKSKCTLPSQAPYRNW
ncbi:MAG: DUF2971 domain-containing protein [Methylobacter sp.]